MSPADSSLARSAGLEDCHDEFASFEEAYIRSYIALADTKAAWAFTIAAGVLAYLFSKGGTKSALLSPEWALSYLLLLTAVTFLVLSAFFSFLVIAPRLRTMSGEGVVFFEVVAKHPNAEEYVAEVTRQDQRALTDARLKHCYDVAIVCARKYRALKKAIWLGLPGLILALLHVLIR